MDNCLGFWTGQLRGGDVAINEARDDLFLSVLIYNKEYKRCLLIAGPVTKENPTADDIDFYFVNAKMVFEELARAGIQLCEKKSTILMAG